MATTNQTIYRLYIALIVFVVLTFILAIATYLFYSRYAAEALAAKEARDTLTQKQGELDQEKDKSEKLRAIITDDGSASVETLQADLSSFYEKDFNAIHKGTDDARNYARLIREVRDAIRDTNTRAENAEKNEKAANDRADSEVAAARSAQEGAEKAKADAEAERDTNREKWDEDWKKHESELAARLTEREQADARAKRLETLIARIREAETDISVERRSDFRAKETAEEQLEMLLDTLRSTTGKLRERNRLVESLRAAEQPEHVVDQVDGRIVQVDADGRTATILFPTSNRIRAGMVFMIFEGGVTDPQVADRKGLAQVVAVEGPLVRVQLRDENITDPISPGDWVSSQLWDAEEAPEVVVIGFVDLNRDGIEDRRVLEDLLRSVGARIDVTVAPTTTLVVDAGTPSAVATEAARADLPRIESQRRKELEQAKTYGHRVIGIDEALRLLGAETATAGGR